MAVYLRINGNWELKSISSPLGFMHPSEGWVEAQALWIRDNGEWKPSTANIPYPENVQFSQTSFQGTLETTLSWTNTYGGGIEVQYRADGSIFATHTLGNVTEHVKGGWQEGQKAEGRVRYLAYTNAWTEWKVVPEILVLT